MSTISVHSAIGLPAFALYPSINCLQWTAEGQLIYLSKNAIIVLVLPTRLSMLEIQAYVLKIPQTPIPGVNIDSSTAVKSISTKGNAVTKPLAWLKTEIEQDKRALYYHWPTDTQGTLTTMLNQFIP